MSKLDPNSASHPSKQKHTDGDALEEETVEDLKKNLVRTLIAMVEIWMDPAYDLWYVAFSTTILPGLDSNYTMTASNLPLNRPANPSSTSPSTPTPTTPKPNNLSPPSDCRKIGLKRRCLSFSTPTHHGGTWSRPSFPPMMFLPPTPPYPLSSHPSPRALQ